jgi:hypothetical protein
MSEPEKIDIAERVFAGMVKKCRTYEKTLSQITACENLRNDLTCDTRSRQLQDQVIARLKAHLATFSTPEIKSSTKPVRPHWQEGDDR